MKAVVIEIVDWINMYTYVWNHVMILSSTIKLVILNHASYGESYHMND